MCNKLLQRHLEAGQLIQSVLRLLLQAGTDEHFFSSCTPAKYGKQV